LTYLFRKISLK